MRGRRTGKINQYISLKAWAKDVDLRIFRDRFFLLIGDSKFSQNFASRKIEEKNLQKSGQADSLPTDKAIAKALNLSYHHRASLSKVA